MLDENIGMRLKAMEYWRCAEVGLTVPPAAQGDSLLKVVIGEPLVGFSKCIFLLYPVFLFVCEEGLAKGHKINLEQKLIKRC